MNGHATEHGSTSGAELSRAPRAMVRRGVASVLSMMFMVIFGALAAAMAVVAQGNMRTAHTNLQVSRAMSAAEAGMIFAKKRLELEAKRFVIEKGVVDHDYAFDLWMGTYDSSADGSVTVLAPTGYTVSTPPSGLAEAIRDAHLADSHSIVGVVPGDSGWPSINNATGTLRVRAIKLTSAGANGPYFILKYEPLAGVPHVRVTSVGVDNDVTRTMQMDFKIGKKIEYAVLSPNRIMIGKNVRVEGPLGSRYGVVAGELDGENADPLVMRSDFYYLNSTLSSQLDSLYSAIYTYDVDGDGRLRPGHPTESQPLGGSLVDYDGDEFVDDFDLFLAFYDSNGDKRVVYDSALTAAAGYGALSTEFDVDMQLARLIDEARPDRDGDGVEGTSSDIALGYRDGIIDAYDMYAKVHGRLAFAVPKAAWESAHGASYQTVVNGPVRHGIDIAPVKFEVGEDELREITTAMLDAGQNWFNNKTSSSQAFGHNIATDPLGTTLTGQVSAAVVAGGIYTPPSSATWESVPYGSPGAYDYYQRQIYENMTFTNVRIPIGNNGLFVNCTFKGVTYIETEPSCTHENWNYCGSYQANQVPPGSGNYVYTLKFPGMKAELGGTLISNTRPHSNNIRFHNCTFIGSISGDKPMQYTHWRNKIQFTGSTRFYIDANDPDIVRDNDAATATMIKSAINNFSASDHFEMRKSSILMPGWSMDIGNFNNEQGVTPELTPKVKLKGTIVAGILDIRGTADVFGTMLMTFRPVDGAGPLFYGGQLHSFNTTIGYFDPGSGGLEDSDIDAILTQGFGHITLRYDPNALLPDGIPWPVFIEAKSDTYVEGGSL